MSVELKIPSSGESISEVQIGEWRKAEGERVERDEIVVEIETDKASMELPSPVAGTLERIVHRAGAMVPVGEVIGYIAEGGNGRGEAGSAAEKRPSAQNVTKKKEASKEEKREAAPAVRRAEVRGGAPEEPAEPQAAPRRTAPVARAARGAAREEERVPMTMLRRRIAERLVQAQQTAALLTTFNEIDLSAVQEMRRRFGEDFEQEYGIKLGLMSFFVKAAIEALKRVPAVNAEVQGTEIVYHNYFDIGVAVATEQGLVVPVLRDADGLSFAETERAIADFAARARARKLSVEELQGGTFTITNGGVFGSLLSTPIVNPPQSGILGLHTIQERPVAREGQVVIRPMMYVALTYDHRLVDGREAVTFLRHVKETIEVPSRILIEV